MTVATGGIAAPIIGAVESATTGGDTASKAVGSAFAKQGANMAAQGFGNLVGGTPSQPATATNTQSQRPMMQIGKRPNFQPVDNTNLIRSL